MLKLYPLERYYRGARAAAVMRPWTQDITTQQVWETALSAALPDQRARSWATEAPETGHLMAGERVLLRIPDKMSF